jgi:hypothetical protein
VRDNLDILVIDLCQRQNIDEVRAASMDLFAEQKAYDLPPTESTSIEFRQSKCSGQVLQYR